MSDAETNVNKNGRSFSDRAVSFLARYPIVWALPLMTVISIGGSVIGLRIIKSHDDEPGRPAEVVYVDKTDTENEAENELKAKRRKFVEDENKYQSQLYPVAYSIEGVDGDVLKIFARYEIEKKDAERMKIFYVEKVRDEARKLKFKQILVLAGGRDHGVTINATINLH